MTIRLLLVDFGAHSLIKRGPRDEPGKKATSAREIYSHL